MSFLAGLVGLLGLLFLLIAIIGVVAPSLFKNKKTGETPKRSELLIGGVVASVIAFVISGWLAPTTEPQKHSQDNDKVAKEAAEVREKIETAKPASSQPNKTLGISPEEFRRSYNQIIAKIDTDYKLAELDIEQGEVNNTFKRMLSKNVGIIGSVNKSDGSLRELMVIMSGSNSPTDNLMSMSVILAATQALNTDIEKEKNSKVVMDMVKQAMDNIKTGKSVERKLGKLVYTASASEFTGLMFAISQP